MYIDYPVLKIKLKTHFLLFKSVQAQVLAWLNNVTNKLFHLNAVKVLNAVICPLQGL